MSSRRPLTRNRSCSYSPNGSGRPPLPNKPTEQNALLDGDIVLPQHEQGKLVSAYIPIVYGCSHACSYCIIPSKRGREHSRPYV